MILILIRGLPGSGKTTLAKQFAAQGFQHFEADMFFEVDGYGYQFDPSKIGAAHKWCQVQCEQAVQNRQPVVIANTFTQHWEMANYLSMARTAKYWCITLVCTGNYRNIHNVPADVLVRMRERWED